ncbi:hypothetical protein [Alloprevotella tannerae]|uniref:hypothetical protein n=1 Tax=Alloprevotella tannerae TaxID=76122 RepID=UPI0028E6F9CD|nr:hypothetical protein [Alloprevotella tannerae]
MKVAKPLISLAVVYLLLGPILFLLERNQLGMEALKQLLPITLLGAFFFAFSFFELAFGDRLRRTQNKTMTGFYLATKVVRLLSALVLFLIYAVLVKTQLLYFTINLAGFYLVTTAFLSYHYIRTESKSKSEAKAS